MSRRRPTSLPIQAPTKPHDPTQHVGVSPSHFEFHCFPDARPQLIERDLVVGATPRGDLTILTVFGSPQPILVYQPYEEVRRALTRRF